MRKVPIVLRLVGFMISGLLAYWVITSGAGWSTADDTVEACTDCTETSERRPEPINAPPPGQLLRDCPDCPEMVVIPGGKFVLGSEANAHASPEHSVEITTFALGRTEVSLAEFNRFAATTEYQTDVQRNLDVGCLGNDVTGAMWEETPGTYWRNPGFAQDDSHPVVCVSWNDAKAYVQWLKTVTGEAYRLPSEAELEYAIRAGSTSNQPWGDENPCAVANVSDASLVTHTPEWVGENPVSSCTDGYAYTAPVGSLAPNAYGLYDTVGNVAEWTEDCWHYSYEGASSFGIPRTSGCDLDTFRAVRGAAWNVPAEYFRTTSRGRMEAGTGVNDLGFRVARDL